MTASLAGQHLEKISSKLGLLCIEKICNSKVGGEFGTDEQTDASQRQHLSAPMVTEGKTR